ncbi:MAG: hypothetical protein WC569_05290 [Candidatus Omnitrophota bacterium]
MRSIFKKRRILRACLLAVSLAAVSIALIMVNYDKIFAPAGDFAYQDAADDLFGHQGSFSYSGISRDFRVDMDLAENGASVARLKIEDIEFAGAELKGDVIVKGKVLKDSKGRPAGFTGKLVSDNMTLNSQPLMDFNMSFRVDEEELEIYSLRFGRAYALRGKIGLKEPLETDLCFEIQMANIRDIAVMAKAKNPDVVLGIMNGAFNIKGPLKNLSCVGSLGGRRGRIGPIGYDVADIRFEGIGPIISIVNSSVKQGNGTFTIEGYIDTRNALKGNIFDGIIVKSDMKTVVWNGWDITESAAGELSMIRDVGNGVAVKFKTMAREPLPTYYERENPEEVSLEYQLGSKKSFKMKLKENEEFLGVEHKTKF